MASPELVADTFHSTVEQILQDRLDFVLTGAKDSRRNIEVLHLIDKKPPLGEPLGYHYVYQSFDSLRHITTRGIFIAQPTLWPKGKPEKGQSIPLRGNSRHYFDGGSGIVVRRDVIWGQQYFEFLRGTLFNSSVEAGDSEIATIHYNFRRDLETIQTSQPIKPLTNLFHQFVHLQLHP